MTPLLPVSNVDSSHYEQIPEFWRGAGSWNHLVMSALRTISSFLVTNAAKLLLIFVPLGIFAGAVRLDPTAVFVLNFLAMMSLAPLLSSSTKMLSYNVGYHFGGLINALFGNEVEMIVSYWRILYRFRLIWNFY
jgi:Ca2+:H+ antiporter